MHSTTTPKSGTGSDRRRSKNRDSCLNKGW